MSSIGERDMPVMDAYRVEALRGDHWRAMFPDGERTYPSRETMARAGQRIGVAVRFSGGRGGSPFTPASAGSHRPANASASNPPGGNDAGPGGSVQAGRATER